jgi:hypothetical protein
MTQARDSHGRFYSLLPRTPTSKPRAIHHCRKGDTTAANARIAELKALENGWSPHSHKAEAREILGLATPPEELPSWQWFNPKRTVVARSVTSEVCGDPAYARSALGGWQQRGEEWTDAGHAETEVRERKGGS